MERRRIAGSCCCADPRFRYMSLRANGDETMGKTFRIGQSIFALAAVALACVTAPAAFAAQTGPCPAYVATPPHDPIVHVVHVIGAPPEFPSADGGADLAASQQSFSAERIAQASRDDCLDPFFAFETVMPDWFTRANLPRTAALFDAFVYDVEPVTGEAKREWARRRPFLLDETVARCADVELSHLRTSGAYPSGHAARGWGFALILAEIAPERASEILQRGREYGDSRVVCGVHWPSDVEAGRMAASAVYARLHADRRFTRLLADARRELSTAQRHR